MKKSFRFAAFFCSAALLSFTQSSQAQLFAIDNSFGAAGRINFTFDGSDFRTLAHLPRADGTSVVVVTYDNNGCPAGRHCLALYPINAAGQNAAPVTVPTNGQATFSKLTGGVVLDPYLVRAAAIDSQGRIVIVGTEQFGTILQFKIVRLLANGQPDNSFDSDGVATPGSFSSQNSDFANAVAIDGQDNIVVVGSAKFSSADTDFAVLRLLQANGAADTSFGPNGRRTIAFDLAGAGLDAATAVDIRGNFISIAGTAADGAVTRIGLARLVATSGGLDPAFCPTTCTEQGPYTAINSGKRVLFYGSATDNLSDVVTSLTFNSNGHIVYAGIHRLAGAGVAFQPFVQKVAFNGDYLNEGLVNTGLSAPLQYRVGGIRYFDRNSDTSNLVITGSVGPNTEFFFAQGLDPALVPISGWSTSGQNNSVALYTASGSFGDNSGNLPTAPRIDTSGRVLLGNSYRADAASSNYSVNFMRLAPSAQANQIFKNGFE